MIRLLAAVILTLALCVPANAFEFHLDYIAAFTPPHNEAIVGNLVERYRVELEPSFKYKDLEVSLMWRAQGAQPWDSDAGNGISEWDQSDWSVDEWRYSYTVTGIYRFTPMLGAYIRSYNPINKDDWGSSDGNETHYDVQVGLTGRFF